MPETTETTLPGLVADLVASRHSGGYRFKVQERVLRQFIDHCRREGYPDGSITKEAVEGFLYGRHPHSLRHGFAVANLRRWAAQGADLAVMLPYLACYMGHADLRGTQYYLRLTADAYPEVMAKAQVRFGYTIPSPPEDQS